MFPCKKKILSRLCLCLAAVMLICSLPYSSGHAIDQVGVTIDGTAIGFTPEYGQPFIDENYRTQVPFRSVLEAFGAEVSWDQSHQTASAVKNGTTVQIPLGADYILKNGTKVQNDTVSVAKEQRIYLPIRIVMEAFGCTVSYDYDHDIVVIQTNTAPTTPEEPTTPDTPSTPEKPDTPSTPTEQKDEMDAMWISYLDFLELPKEESAFKTAVDTMYDKCVSYGMNAVIVQVRADSDAMYPSQYFPWSKFASGTQGKDPGYDPLAYLISAAHQRGLAFHVWINPYRVTGYKMTQSELSHDNPAYIWLHDSDPSNDRWVLTQNGYLYYNPAIPEVRELITNGVEEIVKNYDVDGIHMDDYFYPSVNDSKSSTWFDKPEYTASGSTMTIANWRRNNVNLLVKNLYQTIKQTKSDVLFGISPAGNLSNLRSNSQYFVGIDTWMSQDGYLDYIMPQLYWGFERRDSSGKIASYAYENNLASWIAMKKKGNVALYIGLNMANAGTKVADGNSTSEWLRYNDIIKRQVLTGRTSGEVSGYAFFRYGSFATTAAAKEVANLTSVLKK
jgi:uncharacterized lipoprotein YddW (UPF0748 family)